MTLRTLGLDVNADSALKESLLENDSFVYAHLIKIEKPLKTDTGQSTGSATDFAYLSDAGHDINFNDNSVDKDGNANGVRTYFANRV